MPPSQELEAPAEALPVQQLDSADEEQAGVGEDVGESEKIKLSARDILAALVEKRISITEIKFFEKGSRDRGGHADVVVASLIRRGVSEGEAREIAVKKFRLILSEEMTEEKFLRIFVNELRLLDDLSHPNIVQIIGFVEDLGKGIAWLVLPWESNGNLREFLRSGQWDIPERMSLIKDASSGLEYLHTREPPICHGDLKSLNILVNSNHRALITDFGSARTLKKTHRPGSQPHSTTSDSNVPRHDEGPPITISASDTTLTLTGPAGTLRWSAPEILRGEDPGLASDVWALGWIAWESITDRYPFEEASAVGIILMVIQGQLPPASSHDDLSQIHDLYRVMQDCWGFEPKERPSAGECKTRIRWMPSITPAIKRGEETKIRSSVLLRQMGRMHWLQGRKEESLKFYEEGLVVAQSTGAKSTAAAIMLQLGTLYLFQSQNAKGEKYLTQALELYTQTGYDLGRASVLKALGDLHQQRLKLAEAEDTYAQALEIYIRIRNDLGQANSLRGLGEVHLRRSKFADAEEAYNQGLEIYTRVGNDLGRASTLKGLGDLYQRRSKHAEAEDAYTQALKSYDRIGNDGGRASALEGLGGLHQQRSKHTEAEEAYAQALEVYTRVGDEFGRASALMKLGDLHQRRSKPDEAEDAYAQARENYSRIGNDLGLAYSFRRLGELHQQGSKHSEAEDAYTQGLEIYTRVGNDLGQAIILKAFGDLRQRREKYTEAEDAYNQAVEIYTRIGNDEGRASALKMFGDLHRRREKWADAEEAYIQSLEIYTRIGDDTGRASSSLGLASIQLKQGRYSEAKALICDAAGVSERIGYALGMRTSETLLEKLSEAESASTNVSFYFRCALAFAFASVFLTFFVKLF